LPRGQFAAHPFEVAQRDGPRNEGGLHARENLIALCVSCHGRATAAE